MVTGAAASLLDGWEHAKVQTVLSLIKFNILSICPLPGFLTPRCRSWPIYHVLSKDLIETSRIAFLRFLNPSSERKSFLYIQGLRYSCATKHNSWNLKEHWNNKVFRRSFGKWPAWGSHRVPLTIEQLNRANGDYPVASRLHSASRLVFTTKCPVV